MPMPNMLERISWTCRGPLLLVALLAAAGGPRAATAQTPPPNDLRDPAVRQFDLVVYGFDLDAGEHEVFLRTNPDFGYTWESVGTLRAQAPAGSDSNGRWATAVIPALSSDRYFGQDIRESQVAARIATAAGADGSRLSAVYATPHVPGQGPAFAQQLTRLIEQEPEVLEKYSLGRLVHPRPAVLRAGEGFIALVLAPVRHRPAGVLEVENLEIEFRNIAP